MEKIIKLKELIDEAFSKYSEFKLLDTSYSLSVYYPVSPFNIFRGDDREDSNYENKLQKDKITTAVEKRLREYQSNFIETNHQRTKEGYYDWEKIEQQRIEQSVSLQNWNVIAHDKYGKDYRYYYLFAELKEHLASGKLAGRHGPFCLVDLIANIEFYFWLKEQEAKPVDSSTGQKTLKPKQKILVLEYLDIIGTLRSSGFENKEMAQILGALLEINPSYLQTELSKLKGTRETKENLERIIKVFTNIDQIRQNAETQLNKPKGN